MLENGVSEENLSLRAVARAVGVSAMTPYLHFADRGALLAAVYSERLRDLTVALAAAVGAGHPASGADRLRALADAYVTYGRQHPGPYRLLFGSFDPESRLGEEAGRPAAARSFFAGLVGLVADCLTTDLVPRDQGRPGRPAGGPGGPVITVIPMILGTPGPDETGETGAALRGTGTVRPAEAANRIAAAIWLGLHGLVTLVADKPAVDWPPSATVVDDLLAAHLGMPPRTSPDVHTK